ncbi:hypothetical protein SDC9_165342 [bioreactor metagenome]|uniref:Uncharacterized protein n=1 Tax=bioreactor metagenome TaxID=1076179 RepID=A0A645G1H1_9ZZZZ
MHEHWQSCAGADKYGLEALFEQIVHRKGFSSDHIGLYFHAHFGKLFDFGLHHRLGQTKFRDAIHQHAARHMEGFEYRYFIAHLREVPRAG